jgi:nucleotide-binding universal stress UspA family protein
MAVGSTVSAWAPPNADPVHPRAVVAGVDGTDCSADAAALGELLAETLGTELRVVRVRSYRHLERALGSDEYQVEALVLGSPHCGPAGGALRGGVRRRLRSTATFSILVAPVGYAANAPEKLGHIGVGFDGSPESREAWFEACRIAQATRAALHVYAVHETHAIGAAVGPVLGADFGGLDQEALEFLNRQLTALVAAAPDDLFIEPMMKRGDPSAILREVAGDLDLLVVGTRGLGGIASLLLGSVSAKLMGTVACPVMVVPQGGTRRESINSVAGSISQRPRAERASG